uniref:PH domain-containing protein n=1 Tax=Palpitomonas bilix TaxID=652834 RepID=A0A7S3GEP1_9EUKA|mmetsp:Transcript_46161/g.118955  ORF Transcript_46161/g.118955 Transcript_46161/m.118955 type:complete len:617 (+) Transcript_46161:219-2069(+)
MADRPLPPLPPPEEEEEESSSEEEEDSLFSGGDGLAEAVVKVKVGGSKHTNDGAAPFATSSSSPLPPFVDADAPFSLVVGEEQAPPSLTGDPHGGVGESGPRPPRAPPQGPPPAEVEEAARERMAVKDDGWAIQDMEWEGPLPTHPVEMQGWMAKKGGSTAGGRNWMKGGRRNWKRRYFFLSNDTLTYFENEEMTAEKGSVSILEGEVVTDPTYVKEKRFILRTRERDMMVEVDDDTAKEEWVKSLKTNILFFRLQSRGSSGGIGHELGGDSIMEYRKEKMQGWSISKLARRVFQKTGAVKKVEEPPQFIELRGKFKTLMENVRIVEKKVETFEVRMGEVASGFRSLSSGLNRLQAKMRRTDALHGNGERSISAITPTSFSSSPSPTPPRSAAPPSAPSPPSENGGGNSGGGSGKSAISSLVAAPPPVLKMEELALFRQDFSSDALTVEDKTKLCSDAFEYLAQLHREYKSDIEQQVFQPLHTYYTKSILPAYAIKQKYAKVRLEYAEIRDEIERNEIRHSDKGLRVHDAKFMWNHMMKEVDTAYSQVLAEHTDYLQPIFQVYYELQLAFLQKGKKLFDRLCHCVCTALTAVQLPSPPPVAARGPAPPPSQPKNKS